MTRYFVELDFGTIFTCTDFIGSAWWEDSIKCGFEKLESFLTQNPLHGPWYLSVGVDI